MPYVSRRKPRAKQAEALTLLEGKEVYALLMEMRVGKTKVVYDDWGQLVIDGKVDDLLVVAQASVYRTWVQAAEDDLDEQLWRRTWVHLWDSDKYKNKSNRQEVTNFIDHHQGPRILLINSEALSSIKAAQDLCLAFAKQRRCYGVIDESVIIKNPKSILSKFCNDRLAPLLAYRRILSGLPTPRSPLDAFAQFKFLDAKILGFKTFSDFRNRYANIERICMIANNEIRNRLLKTLGMKGGKFIHHDRAKIRKQFAILFPDGKIDGMMPSQIERAFANAVEGMTRQKMLELIQPLGGYIKVIPKIKNYTNVEEIAAKIAPHSFRVRLDECSDLPEATYYIRDVEMTDEQKRIYAELVKKSTAEIENEQFVTAHSVITRMLRLHQVLCGFTRDEQGGWHDIPENRTETLLNLLDDYNGKVVVWCSYDRQVQRISDALSNHFSSKVARFWGGNRDTREEEERLFRTDNDYQFLVATPAAGGRGRQWDAASLAVYVSNTNNLDHRMQSESRIKADNKKQANAYVDLMVRGTVDEKIVHAMREKINLAAIITRDTWKKWLV